MPDKGSVFVVGDYIVPNNMMPLNRTLIHVKTNLVPLGEWVWHWIMRLVEAVCECPSSNEAIWANGECHENLSMALIITTAPISNGDGIERTKS